MEQPIILRSWPRAIAHVDADAFFASVEQAIHPEYKGRPVITGAERGIVAAASYEAKAAGISRGIPLYQVRKLCPDCVILPSDYETYSIYSKRIFSILRRFTPLVEEYSIDEAFCDLTGLRRLYRCDYRGIAARMQEQVACELDITVSVGVSLTKVLAKLCSRFRKPRGITAVAGRHVHLLLARTELPKVWGFGPNTVALLTKHGLRTALDFARQPEAFASRLMGKVGREMWAELRGECVHPVTDGEPSPQLSISKTKTFTPPSADRDHVWARALRNLESACIKARRHGLVPRRLLLHLRTQQFDHAGDEVRLDRPTAATTELVGPLSRLFAGIFRPGVLYRATGVVLAELVDPSPSQFLLFEDPERVMANEKLFEAVDAAAARFGKHALFLADGTLLTAQHAGERGGKAERRRDLLDGETERQHLRIPLLRYS